MNTERFQLNFFLGLLVGVLVFTGIIFLPFLAPIALAIMFAVILKPVQAYFLRLWNRNTTLASLSSIFFLVVVVVVPLTFLGFRLFNESYKFYFDLRERGLGDLNGTIGHLIQTVQTYYPSFSFDPAKYVSEFADWFSSNLGIIFSSTTQLGLNILICCISLFYVLRDGHKLKSTLIELSPLADKYDVEIMSRLELAVNSVIRGSLLTALVQGILLGIGFAMFNIPNAVLWGSLAAIASLLPLGTGIILIPGVIYLLIIDNNIPAIGLLLWGIFAVGTVDNFLKPFLIRKNSKAHPFFILIALLGGIVYFGPVGIFLGPLVVALLSALIDIYKLLIIDDTNKIVTSL